MNTAVLRKLRRLFASEYASRETQRHNIRQWVRIVRFLGFRYALAR